MMPPRLLRGTQAVVCRTNAWIPAALMPLAYVAVAFSLSVLVFSSGLYVTLAILIAVVAAFTANQFFAWLLPLVIGAAQLGRQPSPTDPTFYVLLAGVHLLHVLGYLSQLLPLRGRIEIAALAAPFRRFALVQAISQIFAFGALQTLAGTSGTAAGLPIAAAAVLALIALILTRGMQTHASAGEA